MTFSTPYNDAKLLRQTSYVQVTPQRFFEKFNRIPSEPTTPLDFLSYKANSCCNEALSAEF